MATAVKLCIALGHILNFPCQTNCQYGYGELALHYYRHLFIYFSEALPIHANFAVLWNREKTMLVASLGP
jgi:hypothetical protein